MGIRKAHAFGSQAVDRRSRHNAPHVAWLTRPHIVRENENDIGRLLRQGGAEAPN